MRREDLPTHLLAAVALIVVAFTLSSTRADADLWGHVRFGQDILAARSIPWHDTYSFTSDIPWINHEWLAEVLMGGAYSLGAGAGLTALKLTVATGTLLIVWLTLDAAGVFRPLALLLLLVVTFGTAHVTMTLRPQVFSILLFAALLALLNAASRGRPRLLLWLPVLFAVWANTHGGWLVGAGVMLLWCAGALATRTLPWPWLCGGAALGIVGTLATPYGFDLWWFLWETVGLGRADIVEWQPLHRAPVFLLIWSAPAALAVVAWQRCGRAAIAALVPVAALGLLALRVARLEGFFAVASVMLLAPCVAGLGPRRLPLSRRPTRAEAAVVGALCLAGLVATGFAVRDQLECVTIAAPDSTGSWAPEAEAVRFLRDNQLRGRLLTWFDYGEIAIWHLSPGLRVSYDGRRETVYSGAVQDAHRSFYGNPADAGYARALGADYVWLPRRLPVVAALEKDGWIGIFRGPDSVVFAREPGPYVQPAPWTGPRCFPGP
jgi:hypothetical protein